jgi:hypothetical protein
MIVPAESKDDWVKALDQVLGNPGFAAQLRGRGAAVAAERTWARSAELTLDVLLSTAQRTVRSAGRRVDSLSQ